MYRAFYGLKRPCFAKDIHPDSLFFNDSLKELESRLDYMKRYRGIMLLSGEPGTGKTTALRRFTAGLSSEHFFPVYIPLSTVAISDFYKQLNNHLKGPKLASKSILFKSIQERILYYAVTANKIPVIMIDEAHLLKNENFFELQIITNFQMDSQDPAIFILIAQSHLNDRLTRSILESFNQRINMKYYLSPLSVGDTEGYVKHHLEISGACEIFNPQAYTAIHNLTDGNIRKIGKLVIKTLTLGTLKKKQNLTEEDVFSASKEM